MNIAKQKKTGRTKRQQRNIIRSLQRRDAIHTFSHAVARQDPGIQIYVSRKVLKKETAPPVNLLDRYIRLYS